MMTAAAKQPVRTKYGDHHRSRLAIKICLAPNASPQKRERKTKQKKMEEGCKQKIKIKIKIKKPI